MKEKEEPPKELKQIFSEWCKAKRGTANPEVMTNGVWNWLVQTKTWPHTAHKQLGKDDKQSPGWCFNRFGQSETSLPDDSRIYIGGEHEDFYDEDFYIYNDVIVKRANGDISIYGYPVEIFPPTDSHSATLVKNAIFIIGCLGYPKQRVENTTPVYKLNLSDFSISLFETIGAPPSWIFKHTAILNSDKNAIICEGGEVNHDILGISIENLATWKLCLKTGAWEKQSEKQ